MRSRQESIELYMKIRRGLDPDTKAFMAQFEGQRFFRFGASWRRLSPDKKTTVVLNDNERELIFLK